MYNKRQRTLNDDIEINPTRAYNPYKHVSNVGEPRFIKQISMDVKGEINSNTVIVRDFHTSFTSMDSLSR